MTHYFKVGIGILAAAVIIVATYYKLQGVVYREDNSYEIRVVFDNIQGLGEGYDVWLSGVVIGSVGEVRLREDGRAELTLKVKKEFKIPRGSTFSVSAGVLQDKYISIVKPDKMEKPIKYYKPNEKIERTVSPVAVPDVVNEAQKALVKINSILGDVEGLVADKRLKNDILQISENIVKTTNEAYNFAKMLKETGMDNRENIDATLANVRILTENLNETAKKVDALIGNANGLLGDEETKKNIKEIVANLKTSMDNIDKTTTAIKDLATDDKVNKDIRETIKSTRLTMENADKAVSSFTKTITAINDTEFKPDFEFRYNAREDLYHADMNVRIFPPSSEVFYLFGFDDLGDSQSTNLQFGVRGNNPELWYKFGLKNGKLGLGFEYDKTKDKFYYGSLSDPNDLRLTLRVGHKVNKNLYAVAGWEGAFKDDTLSFGFLQRY